MCDLMYLIDGFIRLQLIAKNLPQKERFDFLVKNYRELLSDYFKYLYPNEHKVYLDKITNTEAGPWAKDIFDLKNPRNLLDDKIS